MAASETESNASAPDVLWEEKRWHMDAAGKKELIRPILVLKDQQKLREHCWQYESSEVRM